MTLNDVINRAFKRFIQKWRSKMSKQAIDFTAVEAAVQSIGDAQYAQGQADSAAPAQGISPDREAADIAAAVSTAVNALQADDDAKTALIAKVRAALA
jgi:hypothetical protein